MANSELQKKPLEKNDVDKRVYVVFASLLLDLLAFTMILPILPSLLEHYRNNDTDGLYSWLSGHIKNFQKFVGAPEEYTSVLFGGFLGSMFSFLQFIASPIFGSISDVLGRKCVMLCCLVGISLSYILWAFSGNLACFILARFIGGLSKGNVSLCFAIIADVSNTKTRGRGMALVGIAFSLGFIVGPLIGAGFAVWGKNKANDWFVYPALFAFILSISDLIFFAYAFRETLPKEKRAASLWTSLQGAKALVDLRQLFQFKAINLKPFEHRQLQQLGTIYFVYLFVYSGLEFTLTFLTHHVFHYTSMQQGWMFFAIGLIMAILQGGYVRRLPPNKVKPTAILGLWLIIPSFIFVAIARSIWVLSIGLFLFAVSTAMCVTCMTTMVAVYGSPKEKGTVMGIFRSLGALARAVGPIVASIAFWSLGSTFTYLIGALALIWPAYTLKTKV